MKKILLCALISLGLNARSQTYVQITNCLNGNGTYDFSVNSAVYRPLVCNYLIEFLQDPTGAWYISPSRQYTTNGHMVGSIWEWDFDPSNANNTVTVAKNKLVSDLARIKSLGFTEIRLIGASLVNTGTATSPTYTYPTGSQTTYFSLMNTFFSQVNTANLRVILLLGAGAEFYDPNKTNNFKNYLAAVATNFTSSTALMAYDLFNEPQNALWASGANDKYNFSKLVFEWNDCVKKNDPNHLTTIGLQDPWDLFAYDPVLMPIDFVSYHFYPSTYTNISTANSIMDTYYYWTGKTINMPWIIGETSYSAASGSFTGVGTEADQLSYAQHTLQKSVDCNCKGYSWWQYQETNWSPPTEAHMGLFYQYVGTTEGGPKQVAYPSTNPNPSPFLSYNSLTQNTSNCPVPANYYSILNGSTYQNQGYVKDNSGSPVVNAVVQGKDQGYANYITFTDATGHFTLASAGTSFVSIEVSYPGYTNAYQTNPTPLNSYTYTISKVNYNSWAKEYTNADNPNTFHVIDGSGPDWTFSTYDKFYKGDFNGDGIEDVLCAKYTNNTVTNDRMAIYTYKELIAQHPNGSGYSYSISSGWSLLWDNQSSSANGGGIYPYRNKLTVGDFDGDHHDDVISINGSSGWTTWFTFSSNSNPTLATWNWQDSDYGTTGHPMSAMSPYINNVIAGDFYNAGKAAIMGSSTSNWITTFQLVSGVWTWVQSNQGQTNNAASGYALSYLTPYVAQLAGGDFDGDGQKEVLGNALPSGAVAVFKPTWDNTTSQWKWINSSNAPYWTDATNSSGIYAYRNNLVVGNFDSDASDEIFGVNTSYCVAFDFVNWTSSSSSLTWDGSYYPTISDWNIN
ncbi:MAG TPA: carboxypeptidase-like regulatory domain-containing protein, partial [Bacteroidia bacterium]|nr:carboxypeptidase-like regulatory domain-containing protein [Bacteroidia bacterium]